MLEASVIIGAILEWVDPGSSSLRESIDMEASQAVARRFRDMSPPVPSKYDGDRSEAATPAALSRLGVDQQITHISPGNQVLGDDRVRIPGRVSKILVLLPQMQMTHPPCFSKLGDIFVFYELLL
jgi:hypothetical protein